MRAGKCRDEAELRVLDEALADIQLLGSAAQAQQAAEVAEAINAGGSPGVLVENLLDSLRRDVRAELHLDGAGPTFVRIRVGGSVTWA